MAESGGTHKKSENSVEAALALLRRKTERRKMNRLGAELEDIRDRMEDVSLLLYWASQNKVKMFGDV